MVNDNSSKNNSLFDEDDLQEEDESGETYKDDKEKDGKQMVQGAKKKKEKQPSKDEEYLQIPTHFQVELLPQTMDRLRIKRATPPPHIPLCRVYIHDGGPRRSTLKTTFIADGYLEEKVLLCCL